MADELRLELLGGLRVSRADEPVDGFVSAKAQALLCYLAVSGQTHPREALAALLWGEMPGERAAQSLRQALLNLQKLLSPHLIVTRQTVAFDRASPHTLDSARFAQLLAAAEPRSFGRHQRLRQAVELYTGDFLDGFNVRDALAFDEWAAAWREQLRQAALGALHTLAVHHIPRGEYDLAAGYLRRLLALDPWREDAHRQLMLLLAWQGQRDAASAQYTACRRALADELDEEPAAETTALYQRVRAGAIEPPATHRTQSTRLPHAPSTFIGRQAELARLRDLLFDHACRLLTLAGTGGIGKTRLAMQAATELASDLQHGVCFISLAAIRDPALVPDAVAGALGVEGARGSSLTEQLQALLREREALLVFDNFEHLLPAAPLVAELLGAAPRVKALVTSRARLRLRGEVVYDVPPLRLPGPDDSSGDNLGLERASAAVALFVARAQAVAPEFVLSAANARAVAQICRQLEGLPLAIELAAARVSLLSPAALLARLVNRLEFLTDGASDLPARQQTLRATIAWSFQLLAPAEQALFARLSVFAGGRTLAALTAVCNPAGELDLDVLDGVGALVSQSLLRRVVDSSGEPRFVLLETLAEYARERLRERGEEDDLARRHAAYFADLAETGAGALSGPEQGSWLIRLENEHDNLRAALRWAIAANEAATALRLAGALWPFWEARGYLAEGRRWLAESLALAGDVPGDPLLRGRALRGAGLLATWQGDYAAARALQQESLALYRALNDQSGIANALENLGLVASQQGDYATAQALHAESLDIREQLGADWDIAGSLSNLGLVARNQGDYELARTLYSASLSRLRAAGFDQGAANALSNLGVVAYRQGRFVDAAQLHDESLALRRALDDRRGIAISLINLGLVAFALEDWPAAQTRYREALTITWALRDVEIAESLEGLAAVAGARGDVYRAARWLGAAAALRATLNRPLPPVERADLERWLNRIRDGADAPQWDAHEATGQALPLERAVAEALGEDLRD